MDLLALTLPGGNTINPPTGVPSGGAVRLARILGNALSIMIILAILLALIFLIYGGIQWITSGGDKNKIAAARAKFTWAIVGVAVALGAFFFINVFGYFFNIKLF